MQREVLAPGNCLTPTQAGFLAGLGRGLDLEVCGRMGSVAATYAVETYGTSNHRYTRAEFEQRYNEAFG